MRNHIVLFTVLALTFTFVPACTSQKNVSAQSQNSTLQSLTAVLKKGEQVKSGQITETTSAQSADSSLGQNDQGSTRITFQYADGVFHYLYEHLDGGGQVYSAQFNNGETLYQYDASASGWREQPLEFRKATIQNAPSALQALFKSSILSNQQGVDKISMKSSGSGSIYDIQMDPSKVSLPMNSNIKVVSLRYQYCVGEDGTPISFTTEAEEQYQQDGKWTQIQSKVCDTLSQANQIKTLTMPKYPKWVPSTPTQGNQEVKIYYNSGTATVSGSN